MAGTFADAAEDPFLRPLRGFEGAREHAVSMVIETTIAGPSERHADFPNLVVSSALAPFWGAPGIAPTFRFGAISLGRYARLRASPP